MIKVNFASKVIHEYVDGIINERIKELEEKGNKSSDDNDVGMKKRKTFLDMLLECQINGKPLSKTELRDEVNTFMFEV